MGYIRYGYLSIDGAVSSDVDIINPDTLAEKSIFNHKNCSSCEEKIFIGYVIKPADDIVTCAYRGIDPGHDSTLLNHGCGDVYNGCTKGEININAFNSKFFYNESVELGDKYFLNGYICGAGNNIGNPTIFTPTAVIDNTLDYGTALCQVSDNFQCYPSYLRRPLFNYTVFMDGFNFHSLGEYLLGGPLFVKSSYDIYYPFEGISCTISPTTAKNMFPYNIKNQCNYTISLAKDVYEIQIDLLTWAKITSSYSIPGQTNNPLIVRSIDYLTTGGTSCYAAAECTDFNAYRESREWFRLVDATTRKDGPNDGFSSWCRSKTLPADCNQAQKTINELKDTATLNIVDMNFGIPETWTVSKDCCVHHQGLMHDFENYCCNKSYTDLTSKLNCSENSSEERSFVLRFPSLVASDISNFNRFPDGKFMRYDQYLLEYQFPFSAAVCTSKHIAEETTITPSTTTLLGPCVDQGGNDEIKVGILYTPIMPFLNNTIIVELHYCVKSYTACS